MEKMDVRSFDWDDGPLRKAYEIWEAQKKNKGKTGNQKRKWNVGDRCRALNSDNLYYEARIISMNGDFCTIKFLGYDEKRDVDLLELKESEGRKARRKQLRASEGLSSDDSSSEDETSDGSVERHNCTKKHHAQKSANKATLNIPMRKAPCHQSYRSPPRANPASMSVNRPFVPRPAPKPYFSMPPAPPMLRQNSTLSGNPDIFSLMTAWYMAGYYTGLQCAHAENQGFCCRSNIPVKSCCKK